MIQLNLELHLDKAIEQLVKKDLDGWLAWKNTIFLQKLLEVGKGVAENIFGGAVTMSVEKRGAKSYALVGNGEAICFLEFGTGVYADSNHPFAKEMPFDIYAGSWSESDMGAGTWSKWVASGKDPDKYPFNRQAKRGMYEAYKAMQMEAGRIAKEVYKV